MRPVLFLIACAIFCASCGGGGLTVDVPRETDGFAVNVLAESFDVGGSATDVTASPRVEGDQVVVEIRARATGIKAFYFELDYDAEQFRPVEVEQNLGSDSDTIQLAITDRPGTVHAGRILTHPHERTGVSGELLLASVVFERGNATLDRAVSRPPYRASSEARLSITAGGVLQWRFDSTGDYDQNRIVGIADMTPIAVQFDETTGDGTPFPYETIQSVVDGDQNGTITIAEISPISPNFGNELSAYRVYRSQDAGDYPADPLEVPALAEIGEVPYEDFVGSTTAERVSYSFDASALGGDDPANIFWVRPVDGAGTAGTPSNMISPAGTGNQAPVISAFTGNPNPVTSGGSVDLTVTAADPDGHPLTYTYTETDGDTTDTGTNTAVFTAPVVATQTLVTLTVTVDDGNGGTADRNLVVTVDPVVVVPTEVHITLDTPAVGGSGTTLDAYGLNGDTDYTFSATDQLGNDITSSVTFEFRNVDGADVEDGSPFPQGAFTDNVLHTNIVGNGNFHVVGTYDLGGPNEVSSDPELPGEEAHFTIVFILP